MAIPSPLVFPWSGIWPGTGDTTIRLFSPPGVKYVPAGDDRLWRRFKQPRSLSVLKIGSTYVEVEIEDDEDIEAADAVYLGGHTYIVTSVEAAALTTAGFGAGVSSP